MEGLLRCLLMGFSFLSLSVVGLERCAVAGSTSAVIISFRIVRRGGLRLRSRHCSRRCLGWILGLEGRDREVTESWPSDPLASSVFHLM